MRGRHAADSKASKNNIEIDEPLFCALQNALVGVGEQRHCLLCQSTHRPEVCNDCIVARRVQICQMCSDSLQQPIQLAIGFWQISERNMSGREGNLSSSRTGKYILHERFVR